MKIKNLLYCMILLSSLCSYAVTTKSNKEDLIEKMAIDKDVEELLTISFKSVFIKSLISTSSAKLTAEETILYERMRLKSKDCINNINAKFPTYRNLSPENQIQIMQALANKPALSSGFFGCLGVSLTTLVVCVEGPGAGAITAYEKMKLAACFAAAVAVDAAALAASDGGALTVAEEAISIETRSCLRMSIGLTAEIVKFGACFAVTIDELINCCKI